MQYGLQIDILSARHKAYDLVHLKMDIEKQRLGTGGRNEGQWRDRLHELDLSLRYGSPNFSST